VAKDLVSARILRTMNDLDIEKCRKSNNKGIAFVALLLLAIPIFIATYSEAASEGLLGTIISAAVDGVIMVHFLLYSTSVFLVAAPYILFFGLWYTKRYLWRPALQRASNIIQTQNLEEQKKWNSSKRTKKNNSNEMAIKIGTDYLITSLSWIILQFTSAGKFAKIIHDPR